MAALRKRMETATTSAQRLRELDVSALAAMHDAAAEVVACTQELAQAGLNPVTAVLDGAAVVEEWAHYPSPDDVLDPSTRAQYYYHAHGAEERVPGEHGHFHTFLRPESSGALRETPAGALTHLIGISMDRYGRPLRLFTTNRWVTGEDWRQADDVIPMLDRFSVDVAHPHRALNRWLTALMRLFRPDIADLLRARDSVLSRWRPPADCDVHEDRALHVISETPMNLVGQIQAVEEVLGKSPR